MALPKLFNLITWHNNTTPAINEDNLNAMSQAIDGIDDRVIGLAGTIMEDVPQIQEDIEELEEDFALIDEKIAGATSEANRATTKANEAAASVISAGNKALISEGYAKGTQNGTPVGSSSPYYHNNAEYFKEQARSFTPTGYQDLVDDVAEAQEAITDIEGEKVSSNDAYILRQGKGNMVDLDLVGGSVAWNQLVSWNGHATATYDGITYTNNTDGSYTVNGTATGTSTFYTGQMTFQTGHKYYFCGCPKTGADNTFRQDIRIITSGSPITSANDYGAGAMFAPRNEEVAEVRTVIRVNSGATLSNKKFYPQLFDLTAMFGTTIADYIYSLEQATAGAGVEWFRKYFPNAYYAYNAGTLMSVNVKSRKVVGKNLIRMTRTSFSTNGISIYAHDGVLDISGTTGNQATSYSLTDNHQELIKLFAKGGKFVLSFNRGAYNATTFNLTLTYLKPDGTLRYVLPNTPEDVPAGSQYNTTNLWIPANTTPLQLKDFGIQLEYGDTVTDFEIYRSYTYSFDSTKQLRGVPKLVDNKLSYDGDIYTAEGSITRKYGIVDLGTLTWGASATATANKSRFVASDLSSVIKKPSSTSAVPNLVCSKLLAESGDDTYNNKDGVGIHYNYGQILIYVEAYSAYTAEQFKTAMSGVYLVYELATPTTETATPYQNPQRAFSDGTEEFVDAGVTASTRDVSIPVGNRSEYNTSEVLPISQDYTDGAMEILKEIVASSSDFADFKTKVAAL